MIPAVMSMDTEMAVPCADPGDRDQQDPGHDVRDVRLAGVAGRSQRRRAGTAPPSPAPSVPPSTYTNSSRTTTGITAMKKVSDG